MTMPTLSKDGEKVRVTFFAHRESYRSLKQLAIEKDCTVSELLNQAIVDCLDKKKEKE